MTAETPSFISISNYLLAEPDSRLLIACSLPTHNLVQISKLPLMIMCAKNICLKCCYRLPRRGEARGELTEGGKIEKERPSNCVTLSFVILRRISKDLIVHHFCKNRNSEVPAFRVISNLKKIRFSDFLRFHMIFRHL